MPHSLIIWTRLAPQPAQPNGGMDERLVKVRWWVARDSQFRRIVQHGTAVATPDLAHSVHVDVTGLDADTRYWYRFGAGDAESPVGCTRTLPAFDTLHTHVRFATCSCQHYEQGYFTAYRHMVADSPMFGVHLGDYIYEVSFGSSIRKHPLDGPPTTLDEFRLFHAAYKSDTDLQHAHRQLPFFVVPDNHDAQSDYSPGDLELRKNAYQAWYEHMPVRAWFRPGASSLSFFQSIDVGRLLRINLLDTRQFRGREELGESDPNYGFGIYRSHDVARLHPTRTMLGTVQTDWLADRLHNSPASWNCVASTVPFGSFSFRRAGEEIPRFYYGSWDGYAANRQQVMSRLHTVKNPVVVSADLHSFWAKQCADTAFRTKIGWSVPEFAATSISSGWPKPLSGPIRDNLGNNPSTVYYEDRYRGYCIHDVTPEHWSCRMRGVNSVETQRSSIRDVAWHIVQDGSPTIIAR